MYIDKLDDIIYKHKQYISQNNQNNTVYLKLNTQINCSKDINDKDPKFEIDDIVRISKYEFLQKGMCQIDLKKSL